MFRRKIILTLVMLSIIIAASITWIYWPDHNITEECTIEPELRIKRLLNNPPSRKIVVVENTIEASKERLSFLIKNIDDRGFAHRESEWVLLKCVDNRWEFVEQIVIIGDGVIANDIIMPSGEILEYSIDLALFYGSLLPGRYLYIVIFRSMPPERIFVEFAIT